MQVLILKFLEYCKRFPMDDAAAEPQAFLISIADHGSTPTTLAPLA